MINVGKYIIIIPFLCLGIGFLATKSKSWKKNFPGTSEWGPMGSAMAWCSGILMNMSNRQIGSDMGYPPGNESISHQTGKGKSSSKAILMEKVSFREEKIGVFPVHVENIP